MTTLQLATYGVYLVGAITFILALKFLASPKTARTGNLLGAGGMLLVVAWTVATTEGVLDNWWVLVVGGLIGTVIGGMYAAHLATYVPLLVVILAVVFGVKFLGLR